MLIETLHTNETVGITLWAADVYEGKNTFGFQSPFCARLFQPRLFTMKRVKNSLSNSKVLSLNAIVWSFILLTMTHSGEKTYDSCKIGLFAWGKVAVLKFVGNAK